MRSSCYIDNGAHHEAAGFVHAVRAMIVQDKVAVEPIVPLQAVSTDRVAIARRLLPTPEGSVTYTSSCMQLRLTASRRCKARTGDPCSMHSMCEARLETCTPASAGR